MEKYFAAVTLVCALASYLVGYLIHWATSYVDLTLKNGNTEITTHGVRLKNVRIGK